MDETLVSRIGKGFERERGFFTPSALDVDVDDVRFLPYKFSQIFRAFCR